MILSHDSVASHESVGRETRIASCALHIRVLDFGTINRTDLRLYPSVSTKSRVRRYLPEALSRTIGPSP